MQRGFQLYANAPRVGSAEYSAFAASVCGADSAAELFMYFVDMIKDVQAEVFTDGVTSIPKADFDSLVLARLAVDALYTAYRTIALEGGARVADDFTRRSKVVLALAIWQAGVKINATTSMYEIDR